MCLGNLSGLLDILLVGQLVVVRTEHLHGADIAFKADLLEGICVTPVSYTHLDVYKRQIPLCTIYPAGEHSMLSRNTKERNAPFNFQSPSSL